MLRRALKLTTPRLVLEQLATAAVIGLLFLAWLRIPDSSWFYVLLTILVTGLLVAAFGFGETRIFLRLSAPQISPGTTTPDAPPLDSERWVSREPNGKSTFTAPPQTSRSTYLRGTLILLAAFALWYGWDALISHLADTYDSLWAGYWNSRFPHGWRNLFSYPHISLWLFWFWTLLDRVFTGVVAVFAFHLIATPAPKSAIRRNLGSPAWWLTFLLATQLLPWLTGKITGWTPGHGLGIETLSLLLRMTTVVLLDTVLIVFLLATFAAFSESLGDH